MALSPRASSQHAKYVNFRGRLQNKLGGHLPRVRDLSRKNALVSWWIMG